ncbi:MAG: hypothetical protein PEGG_00307 [Paraeggerthella hongkongensis]
MRSCGNPKVCARSRERSADLRTRNRLRWQVFAFRGRLIRQHERTRLRCVVGRCCDQVKRKASQATANAEANSTTPNRQNLPAKAVFRAQLRVRIRKRSGRGVGRDWTAAGRALAAIESTAGRTGHASTAAGQRRAHSRTRLASRPQRTAGSHRSMRARVIRVWPRFDSEASYSTIAPSSSVA